MKPLLLLLAAALGVWPAVFASAQGANASAQGAFAIAQDAAVKADLARAQTLVNQVCAACHGADCNSPTPVNPSLAGQGTAYVALQLAHFKVGIRSNPVMHAMAAPLSPDDMKALGIYFSH